MSDDIRISEITLVNYRQYYGTVRVRFPTQENMFAVLVGANGAGKSNFWNAIHWCLFGNEPHIKSSDAPSIINMAYLYEAEKNKVNKTLVMSVKIIMQAGDTKYLVRRQIEGVLHFLKRDDNNTLRRSEEDPVPYGFEIIKRNNATLFQKSQMGGSWETLSDKHDFDSLVNEHIIPENLSQFFILDGEFLQELFGKFENIKSGIDQISQIHVLNDALDLVEETRFSYRPSNDRKAEQIAAEITGIDQFLRSENYRGVVHTSSTEVVYGTDDPMHATGKPLRADLNRTIEAIDAKIQDLDKKIAVSNAINKTELKHRHKRKLNEKKSVEERLNKITSEHLNLLITDGPFIMCMPSIRTATSLIHAEMKRGKLPNIPKRMLVNDLLTRGECICGARLDEGTSARSIVEEEMRHIINEAQYDIANNIRYNNDQFIENYASTQNRINDEMEAIQDTRTRLNKIIGEIRKLQRQLPKDDKDYARLISERGRLKDERDKYLKRLALEEHAIKTRTAKRGNAVRKLQSIETHTKKEQESKLLVEKSSIINSTIRNIKKDVEKTIREKVSDETLRIFNSLSWKKNYASLFIDDKYHIQVVDDDGFEIVGGMAAGEKLFLALSFIMALRRVTNYKFPFVIDSPLGKTGGNLRISFGKRMPKLLNGSQIIMLATNTEYNDTPIQPEDGGAAAPSLIQLLKEKATIHEYKIDFNKEDKTAKISAARVV